MLESRKCYNSGIVKEVRMTKNMGRLDRTIRLVVALAFLVLVIAGVVHGVVAGILIALAVILVLTTLIGFCPLYVPLKASTKKDGKGGPTPTDV